MIIHNGDHLEFEREHANTPKEARPDWPLPSFDAQDWAKAFHAQHPSVSVEGALAWFAPALMRGFDAFAAHSANLRRRRRQRLARRMTWLGFAVLAIGTLIAAYTPLLLYGLATVAAGGIWMLSWLWKEMKLRQIQGMTLNVHPSEIEL